MFKFYNLLNMVSVEHLKRLSIYRISFLRFILEHLFLEDLHLLARVIDAQLH